LNLLEPANEPVMSRRGAEKEILNLYLLTSYPGFLRAFAASREAWQSDESRHALNQHWRRFSGPILLFSPRLSGSARDWFSVDLRLISRYRAGAFKRWTRGKNHIRRELGARPKGGSLSGARKPPSRRAVSGFRESKMLNRQDAKHAK